MHVSCPDKNLSSEMTDKAWMMKSHLRNVKVIKINIMKIISEKFKIDGRLELRKRERY